MNGNFVCLFYVHLTQALERQSRNGTDFYHFTNGKLRLKTSIYPSLVNQVSKQGKSCVASTFPTRGQEAETWGCPSPSGT